MRYRVRILHRALRDLEEIRDYIGVDAPAAAEHMVERILHAVEGLDRLPLRGSAPRDRRLRHLGYRYLVCSSYLVFYRVLGSTVRVYRILHGRREYRRLL